MTRLRSRARLLTVVVAAALALAACKSKKTKHLEELEAAWRTVADGALKTPGEDDDVEALEAFLKKYPMDDPLGNPHGEEAQVTLNGLLEQQARGEAAAEQKALHDKVAPAAETILFALASTAEPQLRYPDPEPLAPVSLRAGDVRMVTRGRYRDSAWMARGRVGVFAPDIDKELKAAIGAVVYDGDLHRVDPSALQELIDGAYVAPDAPLLGSTARAVYTVFRPFVRAQARLFRVLDDKRPAIQELADKGMGPGAHPGRAATFFTDDFSGDPADRRTFYRDVSAALDLDRDAGLCRNRFDPLDVGFWLRRFDDGSAPVLGRALDRVLGDYDPKFKKELDDMRPDGANWPPPKPAPGDLQGAPPGEEPPSCAQPPASPPYGADYKGPLEGDRVVSFASAHDQIDRPLAAAFDADGETLSVASAEALVRRKRANARLVSTTPLRSATLAVHRAPVFSKDGRRLAVGTFDERKKPFDAGACSVRVLDTSSGAVIESFPGLRYDGALALNEDGSLLAYSVEGGGVAVRRPGAPVDTAAGAANAGAADAGAALADDRAGGAGVTDGGTAASAAAADADAGAGAGAPVPAGDAAPASKITGDLLAIGGAPASVLTAAGGGTLELFDATTGALRASVDTAVTNVMTLAAAPDASAALLCTAVDCTPVSVDVAAAKMTVGPKVGVEHALRAVFSLEGDVVAIQDASSTTRFLWRAQGALAPGGVLGGAPLAMSADGRLLVSAQSPADLVVYSVDLPKKPLGPP